MHKRYLLVIGGGAAGMAAALEAAKMGISSYLIEKTSAIGGHAAHYCCKAVDECAKCSACIVSQLRREVLNNALIQVFLNADITQAQEVADGFMIEIETKNGNILTKDKLKVGAVIIATGFHEYSPTQGGALGYGTYKNVITGLELERILGVQNDLIFSSQAVKKLGFIQCVGSRDASIGHNYCSAVCCMYASKMARLLKHKAPDLDITVFYMDIQTCDRDFDPLEPLGHSDIRFIRGIPAKIFSAPGENLTVSYTDTYKGISKEENFDRIVLSAAMCPGEDTDQLARIFEIATDVHGFFQTDLLNPVGTKHPGVFVAGACQSPKDIASSIRQGKAAAFACYLLFK